MNSQLDTTGGNSLDIPTTDDGFADLQKQAEAMANAYKLAEVLCNTAMVPQQFRGKPDDGAAAILYGTELGLKPQQALQQVFVVHGSPAIYARTMVALLKAKGYTFSTLETGDEQVTVEGRSPRGEVEASTWTLDRAKKAGYTSNKKYTSDPQAMLYAKAASEVARKLAPDVLLGIKYSAEDLELDYIDAEATEAPSRKAPAKSKLNRAVDAPKPEPEETPASDDTPAPGSFEAAQRAIETADDVERIDKVMEAAENSFEPDMFTELAKFADEQVELLQNR